MKGLGKVYPPDSQVLKDIWLSFLPGAKIGVLGLNGAGKSTLLKIMAGEETSFVGEAFPGQGVSIGYLHQEPQLNPKKDVRGNVEEGVAEIKAVLDRYDAVNAKLGEDLSPEEMDKVLGRAVEAAGPHRRHQCLGSRLASRPRDGRAAFAAAGRRRHDALGRRAAPRRPLPVVAALAGPAPPRRTDQPPRRGVGGVARTFPEGLPGHRGRGDARSLLPRQRRRLDSRARSRPRHSLRRQLHGMARAEAGPPATRGEDGEQAPTHAAA